MDERRSSGKACSATPPCRADVATIDELERIAAELPALHGWRRELFGEKALALKHGKLALEVEVEENRVVAIDRGPD